MTSLSTPAEKHPVPPVSASKALLKRAVAGLSLTLAIALGAAFLLHASIDPVEEAAQGPIAPASRSAALSAITNWGYQLQGVDVAAVAASNYDLMVVDESLNGMSRLEQRQQAVARMKTKPSSGKRLVLSYLSIGEAEDYRPYWSRSWVAPGITTGTVRGSDFIMATPAHAAPAVNRTPSGQTLPLRQPSSLAPGWLGDENPEWRGNYRVRFWDAKWQALLFGSPDAALDRIIAAGFDGVYLDRADVYALWLKERRQSRSEMITLIEKIARYARDASPGFIVVMQNAEELLDSTRLRSTLDAVAKEDLLFADAGQPNRAKEIESSLGYLKKAQSDDLPVLVVEYVSAADEIDSATKKLGEHGFIPFFAPRELNQLPAR